MHACNHHSAQQGPYNHAHALSCNGAGPKQPSNCHLPESIIQIVMGCYQLLQPICYFAQAAWCIVVVNAVATGV